MKRLKGDGLNEDDVNNGSSIIIVFNYYKNVRRGSTMAIKKPIKSKYKINNKTYESAAAIARDFGVRSASVLYWVKKGTTPDGDMIRKIYIDIDTVKDKTIKGTLKEVEDELKSFKKSGKKILTIVDSKPLTFGSGQKFRIVEIKYKET